MTGEADAHEFLVLGDLRETVDGFGGPRLPGGRFIVRMFIGRVTCDEEFDVALDELQSAVEARMAELDKSFAGNEPPLDLVVVAEKPLFDPGHAVVLP